MEAAGREFLMYKDEIKKIMTRLDDLEESYKNSNCEDQYIFNEINGLYAKLKDIHMKIEKKEKEVKIKQAKKKWKQQDINF